MKIGSEEISAIAESEGHAAAEAVADAVDDAMGSDVDAIAAL